MADFVSTLTELEFAAILFNAALLLGMATAIVFADAINRFGERLFGSSAARAAFLLPLPPLGSLR